MTLVKITDEEIVALKDKHPGDLTVVSTVLGDAVFRAPKSSEYARFVDMVAKSQTPTAIKNLALVCVVFPAREVFDSWLDAKPGIPADCSEALLELAGVTGKAETKKL